MKYRKKPVVVEAIQYNPHYNCSEVAAFLNIEYYPEACCDRTEKVAWIIQTRGADIECQPGDWIIKGVALEVYSCKPDIFEATYEKVEGHEHDRRGDVSNNLL